MRSFFFGRGGKRNDPIQLSDPHPGERYFDDTTGNAGCDGFTRLSRADPARAGSPPPVAGTVGPVYQGPDDSFEQ